MLSRIIRASNVESQRLGRLKFSPPPLAGGLPGPVPPAAASEEINTPISQAEMPPAPGRQTVEERCDLMLVQAGAKAAEIETEAYDKGFAEGHKAAAERDEAVTDSLLSQYSKSLEQLNKLRREIFANSERGVIRLALEIAKKVIQREVAIDDELILALVKVALSRVTGEALVTIRVNPRDYQVVERHQAALPGAGPMNETVKLVEDPLIGRGGCVIETESGTIDARIERQLEQIEKGLLA